MSSQHQPNEQPDLFPQKSADAQADSGAAPNVQAIVAKFWETVRQSAEVIVTLRQENALVNAQNQVLRKSEHELQARVDELLARIEELEQGITAQTQAVSSPEMNEELIELRKNIDRAEDQLRALNESVELQAEQLHVRAKTLEERDAEIRSLQNALTEVQALLASANQHIADNEELQRQLEDVRSELAARAEQLDQARVAFENREQSSSEPPQMMLFGAQTQSNAELADRLDDLANRVAQLLGIS